MKRLSLYLFILAWAIGWAVVGWSQSVQEYITPTNQKVIIPEGFPMPIPAELLVFVEGGPANLNPELWPNTPEGILVLYEHQDGEVSPDVVALGEVFNMEAQIIGLLYPDLTRQRAIVIVIQDGRSTGYERSRIRVNPAFIENKQSSFMAGDNAIQMADYTGGN